MNPALWPASEIPHQKRIDISEEQFPSSRFFFCSRNIVQQPAQFQTAEIRAQRQASLRAKTILSTVLCKMSDVFRNTRVLPNDRVGDRLARAAFPHHGSLALIGYANRGQVRSTQSSLFERFADHFFRAAHDFQRVVFHPSRTRENLLVLLLRDGNHARRFIKHHKARTSCALIDRSDVILHKIRPFWPGCILRRIVARSTTTCIRDQPSTHLILWDEKWRAVYEHKNISKGVVSAWRA